MTVNANTPISAVTYAGVNTVAYGFRILASGDLIVTYSGVPKVENVHYTVSGVNNPSGGTISLIGTLPNTGEIVAVRRSTNRVRALDYQTQGDFLAASFNYDLDRLWHAVQELATTIGSGVSLTIPADEYANFASYGLVLPNAATRALKTLCFDAAGAVLLIPTADLGVAWGNLPIETTIDVVDRLIFYDVSASGPKTITNQSLIGRPLGDAVFRQAAGQVLSAGVAAQLVLDTTVYSQLYAPQGGWASNQYTAILAGRHRFSARTWANISNGETLRLELQVNGTKIDEDFVTNEVTGGFNEYPVRVDKLVVVAPGDVVRFVVTCSGPRTLDNNQARTWAQVQEMA